MELMWFKIALVLAISDEIHSKVLWGVFFDFYVLLAGLIRKTVASNIQLWLVHEGMEAVFHFFVLSIVFLSWEIGLLAALIHMVVDIYHEIAGTEHGWLYHRALHFTVESIFFIMVFAGL
ncbi:hypothetical protein [Methanobacterium alcaliphilum]|uniref:hypothetical protein n=1 Tax=Methanobacterium alcaliphilum TaxID=392018 RepID=UPI00200A94D6|nr:hypothetical protein [Methanobacterium alcaliphilum]MCK9150821.1 hypothetical protein [Methanobacterium alcaliphilum]